MTKDKVQSMNSEELRKEATRVGIKNAKTFKKEVLLQMVLDKLEELPVEVKPAVSEQPAAETKKADVGVKKEKPAKGVKSKEDKEVATTKQLPIEQKEIDAIVATDKFSKSAKFIMLNDRGLNPAQVASAMNANYSFVYGVLSRNKKKIVTTTS